MAYADYEEVKIILRDQFASFPDNLDSQIEMSEAWINSKLAGFYTLPFDDTGEYASVPVQIKWISALWVAWKIFDELTVLEGQPDGNAGVMWKKNAESWLEQIREGSMRLTFADGELIPLLNNGTGAPRFFPSGTRTVDGDNDPFFKRSQAHEW